jgi:hypothetical protein
MDAHQILANSDQRWAVQVITFVFFLPNASGLVYAKDLRKWAKKDFASSNPVFVTLLINVWTIPAQLGHGLANPAIIIRIQTNKRFYFHMGRMLGRIPIIRDWDFRIFMPILKKGFESDPDLFSDIRLLQAIRHRDVAMSFDILIHCWLVAAAAKWAIIRQKITKLASGNW